MRWRDLRPVHNGQCARVDYQVGQWVVGRIMFESDDLLPILDTGYCYHVFSGHAPVLLLDSQPPDVVDSEA